MISEVWVHGLLSPLLGVLVVRQMMMAAKACGWGSWLPPGSQEATRVWLLHPSIGWHGSQSGWVFHSNLTLSGTPLTNIPSGVLY